MPYDDLINKMTDYSTTNFSVTKELTSENIYAALIQKKKEEAHKKEIPTVERILFYNNDRTTVVFWKDGTKTTAVCENGREPEKYDGFIACLAKKIYGSTSQVKSVIEKHNETAKREKEKEDKEKQKKERCEEQERRRAAAYRNAVRRKMKELRVEQEAMNRLMPAAMLEEENNADIEGAF